MMLFISSMLFAVVNALTGMIASVSFYLKKAKTSVMAFVFGVTLGFASLASAAIPTEISDFVTALGADGATAVGLGIAAWVAYKGLWIAWSMGARVVGRVFGR